MVDFRPWHASLVRTLYCILLVFTALVIMPGHGAYLMWWILSPESAPVQGELVVDLACCFIALASTSSLISEILYWRPQQQEVDPLLVAFGPARSRSYYASRTESSGTITLALFKAAIFGVTVVVGSLMATVLMGIVPLPLAGSYLVVFTLAEAFFSYMVATGELGTAMRLTRPKTLRAMIVSRFVRIPITVSGALLLGTIGWWQFGLTVIITELLLSPLFGLTYERLWQKVQG